jgi:cell division ATPase FtsA
MHPKFRIELSGLTLEPLASSDAVLSQEEKSALIDWVEELQI